MARTKEMFSGCFSILVIVAKISKEGDGKLIAWEQYQNKVIFAEKR